MAGSLVGGELVINHKQLAVVANAEHELVELRVVINSVHMIPELLNHPAGPVGIDQFGVEGNRAVAVVVALRSAVVLDHVIPHVPFPDHGAAVRLGGLDFDQAIRQHVALRGDAGVELVRVEPGGDDLSVGFFLSDKEQDVAAGQHLEVVMLDVIRTDVVNGPHQVTGPVLLLDAAAFATAG